VHDRLFNSARNKYKKNEETKTNKRQCSQLSAHLVRYRFKIRESLGNPGRTRETMEEGFVKEMSFKPGVKD